MSIKITKTTIYSLLLSAFFFLNLQAQTAEAQTGTTSHDIQMKAISRIDYQHSTNGTERFVIVGSDKYSRRVKISGPLSNGLTSQCLELAAQTIQDRLLSKEISGRERTAAFRIYFSTPESTIYSNNTYTYLKVEIDRCNLGLAIPTSPTSGGGSV